MPPMAASAALPSLNLNSLTPPTRKPLFRQAPSATNCCRTTAARSSGLRVLRWANVSSFRVRSFQERDGELSEPSSSSGPPDPITAADQNEKSNEQSNRGGRGAGGPFIAKLGIGLGIAAIITGISVFNLMKQSSTGPSLGFQILGGEAAASSVTATSPPVGFSVNAFGYRILLPESAPGWVYFWLLMAAGCGLFISEEALNIWVGISLSRMLTLDGTWQSFVESLSKNTPYIVSTILWVYWGVCISDMIPFYLGKLFRRSGASDDVYTRLGVGKDRALSITSAVRKYGNLIGFVERFSLGARNPTAFLAGALGISPEYFFAGVCCGALITLPVQLGIGFLLRERPLFALATVATVVGIWSIFPYAIAAFTALFLFVRRRYNST